MVRAFDNILLDGLVVFFTLLFVLTMRSFLAIVPRLLGGAWRWKTHLEIEDSHQLAWSRNLVFAVLFVPSCLLVQSHSLYSPSFFEGLSPAARLGATAGTLLGYLLLRTFLDWQLEMKSFGSRTFIAANRSFYSFWIILFLLLFLCGAGMRLVTDNEDIVRTVLLHLTAVSYFFHILKRGQIFSSACNPFTTILYLCSLELLPTGTLVLSASLL